MIKRTLQELCLNITDGKHGDCENEGNSGYYFISCKDIFDGQINYKNARQITKADFEETHKRTMLEVDDILLTNSGTIGRMAFVTDREATTKTTFQKSVAIIKPDKQKVLPRYLYYQLQNCVPQFINSSNGSAQKNLLLSTMRTFQIEIEENREKQEKIANTLSAYDDLIENNQKQIKLLEEAAQRLYKEWFVDLRFPGYENTKIVDGVPEEWKKNCAEKFFEITIGKTPPRTEKRCFTTGKNGIPWVSIADMGNSGMFVLNTAENLTEDAIKQYNVKVIPKNTVLLSFKLTIGRVAIAPNDICTNEAIAHFKGRRECEREYTYFYLKNFHYDELGSTSSISKAVNSKIIKAMPFIMPSEKLLKEYSSKTKDIFDLIICKQKMDNDLKIARDRILHKLMSGEMEV